MFSKVQFINSIPCDKVIERARHDKIDYENRMFVIPVSFHEFGK
jgi:hypothetical protein